jgi:hypothetical protein
MKCVPMGRPSVFQKSGTDIAGCPVRLQIVVKAEKSPERNHPCIGFSGIGAK